MAGLPDITIAQDYGLPKIDFDFVADPETEVAAAEYEAIACDLAALTYTAARAIVHVDGDASAPSIITHRAVWGDTAGVAPTLTRSGTGAYTLTWATTYDDLNPTTDRRVTHTVNFVCFTGHAAQFGGYSVACEWTANTVNVQVYDASGTLADADFVVMGF